MCVPVPVDWVALYVVHLERRNFQVATIQTVLSAIEHANKIHDLQDPTDNFHTKKLLLAIGKKLGSEISIFRCWLYCWRSWLVLAYSLIAQSYWDRVLYPTFVMPYPRATHISECVVVAGSKHTVQPQQMY